MSIMAKTPSGYKKIGSAYLGGRPVDKVFNANGDVVYALQRELTGVPPLLFKGKEQSELLNYRIYGDTETKQRDYSGSSPLTVPVHDGELYNYRIYGNTVNGESVGDRTGNLFDMKTFAETAYPQNATVNYSENSLIFTATQIDAYVNQVHAQINIPVALRSSCINVQPLTTYTISMNAPYKCYISWINDSFDPVADYTKIPNNQTSYTFTTPSNCTKLLIRLGKDVTNIGDTFTISNIMLNTGSTPLPYEPYGYKVPVTVSNGTDTLTTPIYLPEPIKMVGSEAEYVDFYSQKQYFADGTNTAVTIPALPISAGTNTVTVNTTVQPSNVEVSTDENVSVGDLVTSGQHAGEYEVPVTVSNGTDTLTTPIYLPEPIKMVGDEAEYIDYAEQKQHRVRKNLWDETNGVVTDKFIKNDGTTGIGANGDNFICNRINVLPNTTYTFSWGKIVSGTDYNKPYIRVAQYDSNGNFLSRILISIHEALNNRYVVTVDNVVSLWDIRIDDASSQRGQYLEEVMLNAGTDALPYEPYIENTELDVTLPVLPTIKGTNTLSIDTTVQPSRMDIKGRIKTLT